MSKETQLSETAGAQVSDLSSKKNQSQNICTKEDKRFHKVSQKIYVSQKNVTFPQVAEVANIMQNNVEKLLER